MISWLKGKIIQTWELTSKKGIVLNVGGVGYEIQTLSKQTSTQNHPNIKEFWIHQIIREDSINLYGFNKAKERDLFRKIISVNGIGPQIGMALLEDFDVNQLVKAIKESDIKSLTRSQGIGKRIAERLVVELKNKLDQFKTNIEINIPNQKTNSSNHCAKYIEEIKSILNSLGYMDNEIKDSIELISTNDKEDIILIDSLSEEAKTELMDKHLKKILIRLSQKST